MLEVFQCQRIVDGDAPQSLALLHLLTVRTGIQAFLPNAVTDDTEAVTKRRFYAVDPTAGAVNHLRGNRYPVEFCPQCGGFLTQSVVVCERCNSGVAGFTVQPTAGDELIQTDFLLENEMRSTTRFYRIAACLIPLEQCSECGITVKGACRKAGDFLDGFANADTDSRQNLSDLPVGIGAVAGYDQGGQAMHDKP